MSISTDEIAIKNLLSLGVADVIVRKDMEEKLKSGKKLRIKLGIDPTGFDLHLGHMVVVHKLKEFQDLGHQIILLFGNYTGQIGDPTGKIETRGMRTQEELEKNAEHYIKQVSKVLDADKLEVRWNADWLAPLTFSDVIRLASNFTVAQMLERDMFQNRIKAEQPIQVHELFYALMQGYDSVALEADIEIGGTDQTFNLLAGRTLQKAYNQAPQNVMTMPILVGTDGSIKMGKTTGNYIGVDDSPEDMFGKTMSVPDNVLLDYFELAARFSKEELAKVKKRIDGGENPRDLKMELAKAIITLYHDEEAANKGEKHFRTVFQKKELPENIEKTELTKDEWIIVDLIVKLGMAPSKSEARRLIASGAVKVESKKMMEITTKVKPTKNGVLIQVGKRRFRRIYLKK